MASDQRRLSYRTVTRLIVAALIVAAVLLPLMVGLKFGTGQLYHAIPYTLVGIVSGIVALVVYRSRENRAAERAASDDEERHRA